MSRVARLIEASRAQVFEAAERGRVPDALLRRAVRLRTAARLRAASGGSVEEHWERRRALLAERAAGPVVMAATDANRQHYEVPAELFELMLGPHVKYSSGLWTPGVRSLAEAEEAMLDLTARRADVGDGQRILDLGCGWGSFTIWAARRHPSSRVVALSNSAAQRRHIERRVAEARLDNVEVVTADVATAEPPGTFDRIVSIELLEHVRNHRALLERMSRHLAPGGRMLVHAFTHRTEAWGFDADDPSDWIGRWFFTGGTMPSDDLLLHEQRDLVVLDHWRHSGTHYQRTLEAWLARLDAGRDQALAVLGDAAPDDDPPRLLQRWRMFLIIAAEVWGFRGGREFLVSHYLLAARGGVPSS